MDRGRADIRCDQRLGECDRLRDDQRRRCGASDWPNLHPDADQVGSHRTLHHGAEWRIVGVLRAERI